MSSRGASGRTTSRSFRGSIGRNRSSRGGSSSSSRDYVSSLIDKMAGGLAPMKRFDSRLTYKDYSAPQRAVFDEWAAGTFRPEVERFTLNPARANYANRAAAAGANLLGGGKKMFSDYYDQLEQQSYFDPLEQAKADYERMLETGYQRQLQNYYNAPNAFRSY